MAVLRGATSQSPIGFDKPLGEGNLLAERLRPLNRGVSPTLQESGVEEPVTFIPSTMPIDPELLLFTAYEETSGQRIELYRSARAAVRHAMRNAARWRINEAMSNAAAQEAARAVAREQGTTPPVLPDPRLVGPEINIIYVHRPSPLPQ